MSLSSRLQDVRLSAAAADFSQVELHVIKSAGSHSLLKHRLNVVFMETGSFIQVAEQMQVKDRGVIQSEDQTRTYNSTLSLNLFCRKSLHLLPQTLRKNTADKIQGAA